MAHTSARTPKSKKVRKGLHIMTDLELANLGDGEVAYIKVLTSAEARQMFPAIEGLPKDINLFSLHGADGTPIAYLRRRFVPAPERFATIGRYVLRPGERLDNVAATALGDPLLWWRIADANGALEPAALTREAGDALRLTLEVDMPGPPAGDES